MYEVHISVIVAPIATGTLSDNQWWAKPVGGLQFQKYGTP